ncbi:hypothetical protein OIU78_028457 [Salix suchowensis]|nr:hypothetical protein OIU78_028457 [Salix suchowensis]
MGRGTKEDLSSNRLSGPAPHNGSFSLLTAVSHANNLDLCGSITKKLCPGSSPSAISSPDGDSKPNIGAIVVGVVLLFAALVIWFAYWRRQYGPGLQSTSKADQFIGGNSYD